MVRLQVDAHILVAPSPVPATNVQTPLVTYASLFNRVHVEELAHGHWLSHICFTYSAKQHVVIQTRIELLQPTGEHVTIRRVIARVRPQQAGAAEPEAVTAHV